MLYFMSNLLSNNDVKTPIIIFAIVLKPNLTLT